MIKKMNSMFHKHSRVLFGIFTVIIIITFVGFFTPGQFGFGSSVDGVKVGEAFGEKVTYGDLKKVLQNFSILGNRNINDEAQLFNIYCQLQMAKRLNLEAGDKDVAALLAQYPMFQGNNTFNLKKYQDFLKKIHTTDGEFTAALRMSITLDKLGNYVGRSIIVTPGEVEESYRTFKSTHTVKLAQFSAKTFKPEVKITKDELMKFFNSNRGSYITMGSFEGVVVKFPFAAFKKEAENTVTEAEMDVYYRNNTKEFVGKDQKILTFSEAKKQIKSKVAEVKARNLAERRAYRFASELFEPTDSFAKLKGKELFIRVAAKDKLIVANTGKVAFDAQKIGKIECRELVEKMSMEKENTPIESVVGKDAVYVGMVIKRTPSRQSEFNEVAAKVKNDFIEDASYKKAIDFANQLVKNINEAKSVTDRAKLFNTAKKCDFKSISFALDDFGKNIDQKLLLAAFNAIDVPVGEVSNPYPAPEVVIVALHEKIQAPDMKNFEKEKVNYMMQAYQQKQQIARLKFYQELSQKCKMTMPRRSGK